MRLLFVAWTTASADQIGSPFLVLHASCAPPEPCRRVSAEGA